VRLAKPVSRSPRFLASSSSSRERDLCEKCKRDGGSEEVPSDSAQPFPALGDGVYI
jgi:hypothetical protein